jgi:anti-sigma regulatory factor (Ser/Thr protein kinase)
MVTVERWTLPAAFEAPRVARRLARTYAAAQGAPDETLAAIALCVSEAVTNVVVRAYREAEPGALELEARRPDGYICLYVRDRGAGLTPRVDSPGPGLGLSIIGNSAASVELRRPATGGTEVAMRFDLADPPATATG